MPTLPKAALDYGCRSSRWPGLGCAGLQGLPWLSWPGEGWASCRAEGPRGGEVTQLGSAYVGEGAPGLSHPSTWRAGSLACLLKHLLCRPPAPCYGGPEDFNPVGEQGVLVLERCAPMGHAAGAVLGLLRRAVGRPLCSPPSLQPVSLGKTAVVQILPPISQRWFCFKGKLESLIFL